MQRVQVSVTSSIVVEQQERQRRSGIALGSWVDTSKLREKKRE